MIANRTQLLRHLRDRFLIDWHGHHGASHWVRVRRNGLLLAKRTGANALVVELFAFFHDSCRVNEYTDRNHGSRGAELAVNRTARNAADSAEQKGMVRSPVQKGRRNNQGAAQDSGKSATEEKLSVAPREDFQ